MTGKDFILIAEIIRDLPLDSEGRRRVAWTFAKRLRTTNPAFNTERFTAACEKPND